MKWSIGSGRPTSPGPRGTSPLPSDAILAVFAVLSAAASQRELKRRRRRNRVRRAALVAGVAVASLLLVLDVLIWGGFLHVQLTGAGSPLERMRVLAPVPLVSVCALLVAR